MSKSILLTNQIPSLSEKKSVKFSDIITTKITHGPTYNYNSTTNKFQTHGFNISESDINVNVSISSIEEDFSYVEEDSNSYYDYDSYESLSESEDQETLIDVESLSFKEKPMRNGKQLMRKMSNSKLNKKIQQNSSIWIFFFKIFLLSFVVLGMVILMFQAL